MLLERAQRELAYLRAREEHLRVTLETPARDSAEIRRQVLQGKEGARMLRELESHQRTFDRFYNGFVKGRAYTAKSGLLPGQPVAGLHGDGHAARAAAAPAAETVPAEQGVARRQHAADVLAPGGTNDIGAPIPRGDEERAAVKATL
jgi:hypothetical protein